MEQHALLIDGNENYWVSERKYTEANIISMNGSWRWGSKFVRFLTDDEHKDYKNKLKSAQELAEPKQEQKYYWVGIYSNQYVWDIQAYTKKEIETNYPNISWIYSFHTSREAREARDKLKKEAYIKSNPKQRLFWISKKNNYYVWNSTAYTKEETLKKYPQDTPIQGFKTAEDCKNECDRLNKIPTKYSISKPLIIKPPIKKKLLLL